MTPCWLAPTTDPAPANSEGVALADPDAPAPVAVEALEVDRV